MSVSPAQAHIHWGTGRLHHRWPGLRESGAKLGGLHLGLVLEKLRDPSQSLPLWLVLAQVAFYSRTRKSPLSPLGAGAHSSEGRCSPVSISTAPGLQSWPATTRCPGSPGTRTSAASPPGIPGGDAVAVLRDHLLFVRVQVGCSSCWGEVSVGVFRLGACWAESWLLSFDGCGLGHFCSSA